MPLTDYLFKAGRDFLDSQAGKLDRVGSFIGAVPGMGIGPRMPIPMPIARTPGTDFGFMPNPFGIMPGFSSAGLTMTNQGPSFDIGTPLDNAVMQFYGNIPTILGAAVDAVPPAMTQLPIQATLPFPQPEQQPQGTGSAPDVAGTETDATPQGPPAPQPNQTWPWAAPEADALGGLFPYIYGTGGLQQQAAASTGESPKPTTADGSGKTGGASAGGATNATTPAGGLDIDALAKLIAQAILGQGQATVNTIREARRPVSKMVQKNISGYDINDPNAPKRGLDRWYEMNPAFRPGESYAQGRLRQAQQYTDEQLNRQRNARKPGK